MAIFQYLVVAQTSLKTLRQKPWGKWINRLGRHYG
jgi:hypothetical protein